MSQQLFLLSVTPVQSFVTAARKTQDLYAGSYILSHLCQVAINKIKKEYQGALIFPNCDQKSLPNRLLAVIDLGNEEKAEEQLKEMGLDLEDTILNEFSAMAEHITTSLKLPVHEDLFTQITKFFQVYWTFYPLEGKNYVEAYRQIEASLNSIKNVRKFEQLHEKGGRKCPITGEHNVLYYKNDPQKRKGISQAILVPEKISNKYFAPGEALGGIALVKRCADQFFGEKYNQSFPSTARIALMDALSKLAMKNSEYRHILDIEFNEQEVFELKNGKSPAEDQLAEKVYKQLCHDKVSFSAYYAVLLFDGDSMGKWLAGTKLNKDISLQNFHQQLSTQLGNFAKLAVEQVLIPPKGITIYAGGDDFLGLVNLKYLLEVMKELRKQFEQTIDLSEFTEQKLTFSAGVAIAHYKAPLAEALTWAGRMEQEAKKIDMGKDAFGLALLKHSGEIHKSQYKWKTDQKWSTDLLDKLASYLSTDFSSSFIRTFQFEFLPLMHDNGKLDPEKISDGMVKSEMKRLIGRAYQNNIGHWKEEKGEEKEKKVNDLLACLWQLYLSSKDFNNFLSLLNIAVFLEREVKNNA